MGEHPDIVPEKLESKPSLLIIFGIVIAAIVFHILVNYVLNPEDSEITVLVFPIINPLITSSMAFVVAYRYKDALVFGKAYFALAFGYLTIFLGELSYSILESLYNVEPYPSIADVFFFMQYPLILIHLILNIRFFGIDLAPYKKIAIFSIPAIIVIAFILFSIGESEFEPNFDFYYGLIFVIMSSTTVAFAILGAITFRGGVLGTAWLLLVVGILCNTIGDTWYYNLEIFDQYDLVHPVNLFWYVGYWVVAYSLYKHRKHI